MNEQIPHQTLATGYRPPRPDRTQPELVVLYSQAAFDRQLGSLRVTNKALGDLTVDWKTHVLLWGSCAEGAGMDHTPEVKSLTGANGTVHLVVRLRERPDPQGLDVVTRLWILISAPRAAFAAKDPKVRYEVEGQGEGGVSHDR